MANGTGRRRRNKIHETETQETTHCTEYDVNLEPPLDGETKGSAFVALVHTCFDRNDGSPDAEIAFIRKCNSLGMTTKQIVAAAWIRHDALTYRAKAKVRERILKCGKLAAETFGPSYKEDEQDLAAR